MKFIFFLKTPLGIPYNSNRAKVSQACLGG